MRTIEEIERERKRQRITKSQLCAHAGVHIETYRRTKLGRTSPNIRTLRRLEQALADLRIGEAAQ